ncbi:hypothetical protein SAMN04488508_109171 [Aquimarina spongiae]|uniref:Uncharacterized protein n=1 Tax=Aquimarina spongiae TaxID=570521 RepID=A0A1M6JP39_9FLAO|nr:hypothetical protein SAMN04488508_109171 [Aquimarina spongiae]
MGGYSILYYYVSIKNNKEELGKVILAVKGFIGVPKAFCRASVQCDFL